MLSDDITLPPTQAELRAEQGHRLNDHAMAQFTAGFPPVAVLAMLRRALILLPGSAAVICNMGLALWRMGQVDAAREMFDTALRIEPDSALHHANAGVFASATGHAEDAEYHLREAARLDPKALGPRWDRSLLHLWQGNWDQGLAEYDIRREHRGPELYPGMPYPLWKGEDLTDKAIYIQGEQGVGDRILFSRYITWVKQRWPSCRIYTCINDEMLNLFWEFRSVTTFLPQGVPWPSGIDYGCFLMSLPHYHGSRPDRVPPDPGLFKMRLANQGRCHLQESNLPALRVGVCWAGNPKQNRNDERSMPLENLLDLMVDPRLALYSVQCGPAQGDIARLGVGELIQDLGPQIEKEGWVGTASVLGELDVLVTVCTAVAHLAGALDVPCWTMLCRDPYWIWPRQGETTPWYPSMRLFRQESIGAWAPVVSKVCAALTCLADEKLGAAKP